MTSAAPGFRSCRLPLKRLRRKTRYSSVVHIVEEAEVRGSRRQEELLRARGQSEAAKLKEELRVMRRAHQKDLQSRKRNDQTIAEQRQELENNKRSLQASIAELEAALYERKKRRVEQLKEEAEMDLDDIAPDEGGESLTQELQEEILQEDGLPKSSSAAMLAGTGGRTMMTRRRARAAGI